MALPAIFAMLAKMLSGAGAAAAKSGAAAAAKGAAKGAVTSMGAGGGSAATGMESLLSGLGSGGGGGQAPAPMGPPPDFAPPDAGQMLASLGQSLGAPPVAPRGVPIGQFYQLFDQLARRRRMV